MSHGQGGDSTGADRKSAYAHFYDGLGHLGGFILAVMTAAVFVQVVLRYAGSAGFDGLEEVPRFLFVWLVMIGSASAMQRGQHTVLDYFVNKFTPRGRALIVIAVNGASIVLFAYLIKLSLVLVPNAQLQTSAGLGLPLGWVYRGHSGRLRAHHPADVAHDLQSAGERMAETLLIVFIICILAGMPISIALGAGALGAAMLFPALNPIIIPTRFVGLLSDSYLLLSAPLFILAGNVAARGGVARVLIDFATVLVGRFRGGLAYVNVLDSMFFGGISGSAVADVSALGTFLIPQMVRKGYDLDFATALTVSTAVVAPIIPPSIIAVIYAWMADESVAAMFAAGVIPGILVGAGMAVPVFVIAKKRNYPKEEPPTLPQFTAALVKALPALLIPVIIMGGILFGVFTPTEAAAVAVVYALVVPPIFYREPALRELPQIFADSARLSGVIGLIIGFVGAFGWVLTYSKFPFVVAAAISSIAPEWWSFLILIIALYVVLGTFLTPSEIILVTVPVLLPVAQAVGVHPIHFGMVCVIASAVGHITPPVGLCLFVGMAISGLPMEKLMKPLLPFLAAIIVTLLIVAFVPDITLFLPRLLGFTQ